MALPLLVRVARCLLEWHCMNRGAAPVGKPTAGLLATLAFLVLLASCSGGPESPPRGTSAASSSTPTPSQTRSPAPTPLVTPIPTGSGSAATYTVRAGDTLYSIARRFGTTAETIAEANQLTDPGLIEAGQVLVIPSPIGTPAAAPGQSHAEVIRNVATDQRVVAFTFDAGADAGYTAQILDVLKTNGITASFGILGRWAEQNPDLLRRIVSEGHHILSHSYDHVSFTGQSTGGASLSQAERWQQLDLAEEAIKSITGVSTKPYFRPPYGDYDDSVNADIYTRGYLYNVMWTVDSQGWEGLSSAEITQRCLGLAEPGAIYVFHVGADSQDAAALPDVIQGLQQMGYSITSVPRLLASR